MTETRQRSTERVTARAAALNLEGAAIVVGGAALVLGALASLPFFWGRSLPIAGPGSVSQFTALAAGVVGVVAYVVGRLWHRDALTPFGGSPSRQPAGDHPARRAVTASAVFDTIVIGIAHGIIALLGWLALGAVLADGFTDATVYAVSATALAGVAVGVTAYAVFLSATRIDLMRLSTVLAVFAIVGIIAAMLSAPDPHWWQYHLSALGMSNTVSSLTFNLTLIVAGLMMAAIARYATDLTGVEPEQRPRLLRVRVCLILIGVLLAGVGLFPLDVSQILHNVSAVGMLIAFALLVFWVRPALPGAPRSFFVFGYVSFGVIVLVAVFFVTGYYVLTATELVAGVIVFGWLTVFLRVSGAGARG
ncbi:DUF998 domain-containing protein [Leifsonia shinshuensis]|uniref:DUF998 domain-containing protein n=1 Tax=Leifsonia TaxID=110932 RepID=UPI00285709F4|nr:DUF998 domain-containing protein [Leifsonia shinshuensis]MDR6969842.1 putative membrane protein [Leifsonia shinshuensis]